MSQKWFEYAKRSTAPDEKLDKNFDGKLDGQYGHLMITDKKIFFVKEEGFLRKKYSIPFILTYDKLKDVNPIDRTNLQITDKSGKTHRFVTDISVSSIRNAILTHAEMH
jgi:hypothetical protein